MPLMAPMALTMFVSMVAIKAHDITLPLCSSQAMTDIMGHDLPGLPPGPPPTTDAAACCNKCKTHAGCVAFVYEPHDGHCYLKRSLGKTNHNPDRLLAFVNATCGCDTPKAPKCWSTPHPCSLAPSPGPAPPQPPNPKGPPSASFNRLALHVRLLVWRLSSIIIWCSNSSFGSYMVLQRGVTSTVSAFLTVHS